VRLSCLTLLVAALAGPAGPAGAADFLADPKAMCTYLAASGMKAQLEWSQPQPGGPYFCKYVDEFSGNTAVVRGGTAVVDPATGEVTLSVVVQCLGDLTRLEAKQALQKVVADFYGAQGQTVPEPVAGILGARTAEERRLPAYTAAATGPELWDNQRVVGLTLTGKATAASLAQAARGPSAQEKAANSAVKKALGERCRAAIADSGQGASPAALQETATQLSASRYLFQYADPAGGSFTCQACDEADPKVNCGVMGAMLTYTPKGGSPKQLPAEFDRKCVYHLQHELMPGDSGVFIDHALVGRTRVAPAHTDARWVYRLELDGREYRCVIRKSDWSFRLEGRAGDTWRGLVAGTMF
jgi:hypothetical protein